VVVVADNRQVVVVVGTEFVVDIGSVDMLVVVDNVLVGKLVVVLVLVDIEHVVDIVANTVVGIVVHIVVLVVEL
jgi:hypothetical protein